MKTGVKTTEFYLSLIITAAGAIAPMVTNMSNLNDAVSIIVAAATAVNYTLSRTSLKGATANLVQTPKVSPSASTGMGNQVTQPR